MSKQEHLKYINDHPFDFRVSKSMFSEEEVSTIEKYGNWYKALLNELLDPNTDAQQQFIDEMNSREEPTMEEVKLWKRYLRKEIEESGKLDTLYRLEDDPFYSREGAKTVRKQMFAVTNQGHRG